MFLVTRSTAPIILVLALSFRLANDTLGDQSIGPDKVFLNGVVVTMVDAKEVAEAVAVRGGKIVAVGSNDAIRRLATATTQIEDLGGATLLPGFYAAHDHFPSIGRVALYDVDLNSPPIGSIRSIEDIVTVLRDRAAQTAPGKWIVGRGYDDTLIDEQRHPTRVDLDRASMEHPIWIVHTSGHLGVANSKALELAKVTRDTPQPEGGLIRMDAKSGEPTGIFEEKLTVISQLTPVLSSEQQIAVIRFCDRQYLSKGVTTTIIAGGAGNIIPNLIKARELGSLHLRAIAMSSGSQATPPSLESLAKLCPIPERVRFGAVKLLHDGSLQGYTGFLTNPYYRQPEGKTGYAGYPSRSLEKLVEMVGKYHRAGYQIAIHGNGDAAIDEILVAYQEAQAAFPRNDARHRIEHCQTPREDQLVRMRELGVTPSFFVAHVYYWGDRHRDLFLGPERAERISPLASARNVGLRFTIHNDTPVTPVDPMHLVWCAVNRVTRNGELLGAEQRIDVYSALRAVTQDAAWQNFEETTKGSIEIGKVADFVVLAENPFTVPSIRLKDIQIRKTIVDGEVVYENNSK
ncbi:MAG: amidohydrolase [Pirellulaceae bacterium]|nr:amidohydrolase [Pirellulaceae bacterium]